MDSEPSAEKIAYTVFADWCNAFDVSLDEIHGQLDSTNKTDLYDTVFRLGAQKFLDGFLAQNQQLNIPGLKAELLALRAQGDNTKIAKRELEIAQTFQSLISRYTYKADTNHPKNILDQKEMNCVGASFIGGLLLTAVGINSVCGGDGSHVFLIMTTSDNRVWWQDMQDGKETPELYNQELTTEKVNLDGSSRTADLSKIINYIQFPTNAPLSFTVRLGHRRWENELITIEPLLSGIELSELINTGFRYTNDGNHAAALEILEIAKQKSPDDAVIYLGLARALHGLGRYDEAIVNCQQSLSIDPEYTYVRSLLTEIQQQKSS